MGALADALVSKGGYSAIDAQNAERGPRASDLAREFLGSSGGMSGGGGAFGQAQQFLDFQRQANQPAIASLQGQLGEVSQYAQGRRQKYESEIEPLKERYARKLEEAKARVGGDLAREYGRRGLSTSSGMYETDYLNKVNSMSKDYMAESEAGVKGLQDLIAGLFSQETEGKRSIMNAIAQLQAGNPSDAITSAMSLWQQQQQAARAEQDRAFQERVYRETTLPESQTSVANARRTASNSSSPALNYLLQAMQGGGGQPGGQSNQLNFGQSPVNIYKGMPGLSF